KRLAYRMKVTKHPSPDGGKGGRQKMERRLMVEFKTEKALSTWEYLDLPIEAKLEDEVQDAKMEMRFAEIKVRREMDRIRADLLRLVRMIEWEMMDDQQYEVSGHGKAEDRQSFDKRVGRILGEIENVMGNLRLQAVMDGMMAWAGHRELVRRIEWMLQR